MHGPIICLPSDFCLKNVLEHTPTLPETNSLHLKIGLPDRKVVFQPSIFRGLLLLVSGRVTPQTTNNKELLQLRNMIIEHMGLSSEPTAGWVDLSQRLRHMCSPMVVAFFLLGPVFLFCRKMALKMKNDLDKHMQVPWFAMITLTWLQCLDATCAF